MTLPVGISTCTVTVEHPVGFDGDTTVMTLEWQPVLDGTTSGTPKSIVWEATGQALISFSEKQTSTDGGSLTFELPHVDQAGFVDGMGNAFTGWAYRATVRAKDVDRKSYHRTKDFQVFVGQDNLTFDLIDDGVIVAAVSAPTARVTSVNGQTGAVVVPDAGDVQAALDAANAAQATADAAQPAATLDADIAALVPGVTAVADALGANFVRFVDDATGDPITGWVTTIRVNTTTGEIADIVSEEV